MIRSEPSLSLTEYDAKGTTESSADLILIEQAELMINNTINSDNRHIRTIVKQYYRSISKNIQFFLCEKRKSKIHIWIR